jgi:integrase
MNAKVTVGYDPRNKKKPHIVRWYGDYDLHTGKQRRYSKAFRLKAKAEQFAAQKTVEFTQGAKRDKPQDITLGSFCKDWLSARKPELRQASLESYENTIARLEDFFGKDCKLRCIDAQRAAVFVAEQKSRSIGHEGKELSDASREQIKRNCKCIFNTAVDWGLLTKSPFKGLRSKRLVRKRWHRLTVKEYYALLDVAKSVREKVAYSLLYTGGPRMGEAFSLTWDCIDFENSFLVVANREGTADMPPFHIKDHEARRIPLPKHTIDLLTKWQSQAPESVPYILLTKERYERVKAKWHGLREKRKPWRNRYMVNNVLRNFKSHYKRAGIKPVGSLTVHTLRKCAGQNWADHLPMNVVKELMGHSSIATTQEYYTQVDRDHEVKAVRAIQRLLEKETDVKRTYEPISGRIGAIDK